MPDETQTANGADGQTTGSESASTVQGQGAPEGARVPQRPDGLPDDFWNAESGVKLGDLIKSHGALSEAARERLAGRPETAKAYAFKVPETYRGFEDLQKAIDSDSPFMSAARKHLFETGATQEQANELFESYMADRFGTPEALEAQSKAERAKLGEKADTRVEAVNTWIKGHVGDDLYSEIAAVVTTAAGVEAMEKLMDATKDKSLPNESSGSGSSKAKDPDPMQTAADKLFHKTPRKAR